MDSKRLILFIALSFGILFFWQKWMSQRFPQPANAPAASAPASADLPAAAPRTAATAQPGSAPDSGRLQSAERIHVKTDLFDAQIDSIGGDLRRVALLKHGMPGNPSQPFVMFTDGKDHTYVAQTGLLGDGLPTHKAVFTAEQRDYALAPGQDALTVRLTAAGPAGVQIAKVYTFRRGQYLIDVKYEIVNGTAKPLTASAYYRLLRDGQVDNPGFFGAHTFTGPAVYTETGKFQKADFSKLDKGSAEYVKAAKDGWVAMIQHYFASAWVASPKGRPSLCGPRDCRYEMKRLSDGLYSAGVIVDLPTIAAGGKFEASMPLFVGPQETRVLDQVADGFDLVKDYGIFTVFSKPLFWVLDQIHKVVGNWGWAIILLTVLIKAVFYPLASASYRSMARMRKLAPRMEQLKERHGDDKVKFQQAVMEMYKTEKVNPLGGCLPMLVQIPIFIALYWALIAAVELRQAPWMFWIHDLSVKDPYFVLPILMAVSMYIQTSLSPPPPDPMQAKMMKIMPLAFSVFFLFFPAGLVLYYVVNNVLSILQQWWITRTIENADKDAKTDKPKKPVPPKKPA
ncbi:membrane protein insertase YidC [Chitiniphilus shinanonensis]|uniref:Membrane protein insertase YidC n=1 Tax=Chitiniphilus shinanonensis TaxID=553088 RepID=A0ABQ6C015_9NEIS|nr:membrane protein insertase YidC [Chitiniphilus shinanonensis]GLS05842.1 membrane protein insertase YidC [Chitiniphilus shinanonensis]